MKRALAEGVNFCRKSAVTGEGATALHPAFSDAHSRARVCVSGWLPGWILSEIRGANFAKVPAVYVDPGQKQVLAGVRLVSNAGMGAGVNAGINAGINAGTGAGVNAGMGAGVNAGVGAGMGAAGNDASNAGPDGSVTFQPFRIPTGFWHHRTGSNRLRGKKERRDKAELTVKERMARQRAAERRLVEEGKRQAMHEASGGARGRRRVC